MEESGKGWGEGKQRDKERHSAQDRTPDMSGGSTLPNKTESKITTDQVVNLVLSLNKLRFKL